MSAGAALSPGRVTPARRANPPTPDFMNVAELDLLKSRLDARRPLDPAVVRNLRDDLIVRWTYHSNAIEGNSLTLRETKVVLEGVTVGGKRMTDHLEAINHRDAILLLEELVQKRDPLNERQIKSLHQPSTHPARNRRRPRRRVSHCQCPDLRRRTHPSRGPAGA